MQNALYSTLQLLRQCFRQDCSCLQNHAQHRFNVIAHVEPLPSQIQLTPSSQGTNSHQSTITRSVSQDCLSGITLRVGPLRCCCSGSRISLQQSHCQHPAGPPHGQQSQCQAVSYGRGLRPNSQVRLGCQYAFPTCLTCRASAA